MKRLVSILLIAVSCISVFSFSVYGRMIEETQKYENTSSSVINLSDGYYAEITIGEYSSNNKTGDGSRSTLTKYGYKDYILYDKNGTKILRFVVNGTFSVNSGVSSTCTLATYRTEIYEDAWQEKSASATKSGNKAIGDATFIKKTLFITTDTEDVHLVLTCDKNGNLS